MAEKNSFWLNSRSYMEILQQAVGAAHSGFKICLGYRESNQRFVHLILGLLAAAPTAGCRISMQEQEFNQQLFSALSHKQFFFSHSAALSTLLPLKADYILVLLLVRNLFPLVTI